MRLAMMKGEGGKRLPAATDALGRWHDLTPIWRDALGQRLIPSGLPADLDALVRLPNRESFLELVEATLESVPVLDADAWRYDVPLWGGDLICVGRNYAAHARELGNPIPSEPILFMKPRTCLLASDEELLLPADSVRVELEGELALVIGQDVIGDVSEEQALSAVFGVTLVNDITDRGKQSQLKEKGKPWLAAKGRPGFAPLGPTVVPLKDPGALAEMTFTTSVNGEVKQRGEVALWLWPPAQLVQAVAAITGLRKGDLLATGTPAGVCELHKDDRVVVSNKQTGELTTRIRTRD